MAPYSYLTLKSPRHIRLVHLHPPAEEHQVPSVSISQTVLDEHAVYEALSYSWDLADGPRENQTRQLITVNQPGESTFRFESLLITSNLYHALSRLRPSPGSEPRCLWIDAICINQNDAQERTQQVQIMGKIYNSAQRVLAWLGESVDADEGAIEVIPKIANYAWNYLDHHPGEFDHTEVMSDFLRGGKLPTPSEMAAVGSFFSRRWFRRLWVLQEIILAQEVIFICGNLEIDQYNVTQACEILSQTPLRVTPETIPGAAGYGMITFVQAQRQMLAEGNRLSAQDALDYGRLFKCTLGRDRLYAFLGMIDQTSDPIFTPDYLTADGELWTQWTIYLLKQFPFDSVLVFDQEPTFMREERPSWVRDYHTEVNSQPFGMAPTFCTLTAEPPTWRLEGSKFLHLSGVKLGYISILSSMSLELSDSLSVSSTIDLRQRFVTEAQNLEIETFGEKSIQVKYLWRTLVADQNINYQLLSAEDAVKIEAGFLAFQKVCELANDINARISEETKHDLFVESVEFEPVFHRASNGRKFGILQTPDASNLTGLFPKTTMVGDIVYAFAGSRTPHVVRRVLGDNMKKYHFVGECFIHGVMRGELADVPNLRDQFEEISLV